MHMIFKFRLLQYSGSNVRCLRKTFYIYIWLFMCAMLYIEWLKRAHAHT